MNGTRSLTLIISMLSAGGAERVVSVLANHWARMGWNITVLTLDDGSQPPFYPLDPRITHRPLNVLKKSKNLLEKIFNNFKRIWVLRKAIKNNPSQTVVSVITQTNILTLMAAFGLGKPVIVWEQNDPEFSFRNHVWRALRNLVYPLASRIVLLTESNISYFPSGIQRKTAVIPNPVIKPILNGQGKRNQTGKKILLAMGRLDEQKGFDLLLKAFAEIAPKTSDWTLQIWGEGPLRDALEKLRDQLSLKDKVQFPGLTQQPYETMRNADLFVMSSRYEGLPLVLGEAMACGMPVISFACHGPRDMIQDGIDGVLVAPEDVPAMSVALKQLMDDEDKRKRLSACSPKVLDRFGLERVLALWDEVLQEPRS